MSFSINTSISSMQANHQINKRDDALTDSLGKIASGHRITQAADDASGMAIADSLRSQAQGYGQAMRNASDGISIVQTADGALSEASGIIQDIQTKALEAANGSQSAESRQALQADIDKSLEALNDIAQSTSFNGQKLLSGEFTGQSFAVGANSGESINISIGSAETGKLGSGEDQGSLADIDVTTQEGAAKAFEIASRASEQIDNMRSNLGSTHNEFESTINNLATTQINTMASESKIRDVDIAEESMNMKKMDNLKTAGIFAMAQSNANAQNVLSLLG